MSTDRTPQLPSAANMLMVAKLLDAGIQSLTIYVLYRTEENRLYSISDPTDYIVSGTVEAFANQLFFNEARAIQECRTANEIARSLQHQGVHYFYREFLAT